MNFGKMGKMMQQLQQMQEKMETLQAELADRTVEASAGGGVVTVVCTGSQEVKEINIDPEAVDPDDPEMLQDLVTAAVNEGLRKSREMVNEEMGKITQGMNIPGMPGGMPGLPGV